MDFPPSPSRVSRSQSSIRGNKRKILTNEELLLILESDELFSSKEEFVGDSDNDYLARI